MTINFKLLDMLRKGRSEHENHLIDGLVAGRVSRREFLRFGSVLGLSLPYMGALTGAVGLNTAISGRALAQTPGGTIRVGQIVPAAAIEPVKLADGGGITTISQVGETLVLSGKDLVARPLLAESWAPNADGSVWTFKIRKGVKFHDGSEMTAKDVVASIERIADPANGSNALSALKGVLSKGGTKLIDDYTVEFTLDAPNGGFPYTLSTDNYNAIIIPANYDGDFESKMIGTGPFKLESYQPKVGASFVRNEEYWGVAGSRRDFLLRRLSAADPRASGRSDRLHPAGSYPAGGRHPQRPERGYDVDAVAGAPAGAHEHDGRCLQGQARSPGHRALPRPSRHRAGLDERQSADRQ
jgi:peptide/nickel transport system substrate-binding protein